MTDNRTTELLDRLRSVGNLHEFAELFGFNWEDDSDWTWHDVAVKMADELEQAIAATLGEQPAKSGADALSRRARDMARYIQGNLGRCLYRRKDVVEMEEVSETLMELADALETAAARCGRWWTNECNR